MKMMKRVREFVRRSVTAKQQLAESAKKRPNIHLRGIGIDPSNRYPLPVSQFIECGQCNVEASRSRVDGEDIYAGAVEGEPPACAAGR
ncbi:unnamed protein product [Somion occarium]|uniref:Uncharacterized protein n=1 Tax=Somion occarium TaxID=3059160 RepID=A0ABP1E8W8_9APHY